MKSKSLDYGKKVNPRKLLNFLHIINYTIELWIAAAGVKIPAQPKQCTFTSLVRESKLLLTSWLFWCLIALLGARTVIEETNSLKKRQEEMLLRHLREQHVEKARQLAARKKRSYTRRGSLPTFVWTRHDESLYAEALQYNSALTRAEFEVRQAKTREVLRTVSADTRRMIAEKRNAK